MPWFGRLVAGFFTAQAGVQYQTSPRKICDGQGDTRTGFSPCTSVSPFGITAQISDTHSFIYHRRHVNYTNGSVVK